MNSVQQTEPEIREDLWGRIEVFDQNIRSFEKRLRAIERRLSIETPISSQAGRNFSGGFTDAYPEENLGAIAAGSSVFPREPSIAPKSSIPESSYLSGSVPLLAEGSIPNFAVSAAVPACETANSSVIPGDNFNETSAAGYKIVNANYLISNISESLRALQTALSELSNYVHNDLRTEIENTSIEEKNLKDQVEKTYEDVKKLELRIESVESQSRLSFGSIRIPLEISGIAGSSALLLSGFLIWAGRWDIIRSPYFPVGLAILMAGAVIMKFFVVNSKRKSLADGQ